ncbi:hypothetical protein JCM8097_008758 [Rhodosporidiobolus ruineniae]
MASYYLDPAFDSFTSSFQTSSFDDSTNLLSAPSFDLDSTIFSDPGPIPSRTTGPSSSTSNYTYFPEPLQTLHQPPTPLNASTASNSFPLFDPDSPFNSPASQYPVRGLTKDGRLKTRLMGVGSDGGFLTSPLIVGKPRVDSRTGRVGPPEIAIDSPAPATPQAPLMTPGDSIQGSGSERTPRTVGSEMAPSLSMGSTASSMGFTGGSSAAMSASSSRGQPMPTIREPTGLGMGITGVPDLQEALENGAYDNPNLRIYGLPKQPSTANGSECGFLPYPEHMPTTTLGRGRNNLRDVGSGVVDANGTPLPLPPRNSSSSRFVEHRFFDRSATQAPPPHPQHRPTKALPTRTINKAKSCSALAASAREQARLNQPSYEPMTPSASQQNSSFLAPGRPGVPFNSPHDVVPGPGVDGNNLPFSFSDLYSLGLTADPLLDDVEPAKKSPYEFAEELLASEPNLNGVAELGAGIGLGMGVVPDQDLSLLHAGLPAGYGPGSTLSSPSTPYLSDPSPEAGSSTYQSHDELTSHAMLNASSVESTFSTASHPPMPSAQHGGRQRCVTYRGLPMSDPGYVHGEDLVDPALLSPQHRPARLRQPTARATYGASQNFSYPTRYAPQPATASIHQQLDAAGAPPMAWSGSQGPPPIPATPSHRSYNNHQRSVTGPPIGSVEYASNPNIFVSPDNSAYDRNLAQFDSLYEQYEEQQEQSYPTPTKRSRRRLHDSEEEDDEEARSPDAQSPGGTSTRAKRLRTVASAPCLPARRMRPGPKPKANKSPAEQHQSVFSATLSPPIPQIRRASSPYASPLLTDDDDEDDGARFPDRDANGQPLTAATITYTPGPPPLPGQPRSSVPREVIQSLYSSIPSHVANGVKVPKRYVCLIEGCERTFPRKSAIESHIQTHLEDKPFVCPHDDCDASFVRQHDLRRHERIHSGNKPFPCPCGKGFARGDALARHRARGICSGSLVPRRV